MCKQYWRRYIACGCWLHHYQQHCACANTTTTTTAPVTCHHVGERYVWARHASCWYHRRQQRQRQRHDGDGVGRRRNDPDPEPKLDPSHGNDSGSSGRSDHPRHADWAPPPERLRATTSTRTRSRRAAAAASRRRAEVRRRRCLWQRPLDVRRGGRRAGSAGRGSDGSESEPEGGRDGYESMDVDDEVEVKVEAEGAGAEEADDAGEMSVDEASEERMSV